MGIVISWLVLTVAFAIAAQVVKGFEVKGVENLVVSAAVFGVLNFLLGWLLHVVLAVVTLLLSVVFFGVTSILVNAVVLMLASKLTDRLKIDGCVPALVASFIITVVALGLRLVLRV